MIMPDVLVVDDDASVRDALAQTLELHDLTPRVTGSFIEAKDHIDRSFTGVILSDIRMPGRDGFHLLKYAHEVDPDLPVVLLTGEGDIPMAVEAMALGAFDFLEKPCAADALVPVLRRALQNRALILENRRLKTQLETGDPAARLLFGISEAADALRDRVRRVAAMRTDVLVTGPPGAGISKVAEVIHLMSPCATEPFVKKSASALTDAALADCFAEAKGGSLLVEDIQALPQASQYSLYDSLEQETRVRLIAGTSVDLAALAQDGRFHAELYYRLEVASVRIPSLAERPQDIPALFRHYVAQAAEQAGIAAPDITPNHVARMMAQDWPGNTRSLMSAAMRFVLGMPEDADHTAGLGLAEQLAQVERALLISALGRQNGKASEAAKALKLPRKTFYDKLARYGIKPDTYRRGTQ